MNLLHASRKGTYFKINQEKYDIIISFPGQREASLSPVSKTNYNLTAQTLAQK